MAAGMTIPMMAWMLFRGMGRRNAYEMAAAMVLPVVPFLCLVWFGVTQSAWCGAYCATTIVAMLVLMGYRRSTYSMAMWPERGKSIASLVASAREPDTSPSESLYLLIACIAKPDKQSSHPFVHFELATWIFQDRQGQANVLRRHDGLI
jgi:hypothetical protein